MHPSPVTSSLADDDDDDPPLVSPLAMTGGFFASPSLSPAPNSEPPSSTASDTEGNGPTSAPFDMPE